MNKSKYPSLYQMNTRVWLNELSRSLNHRATLDDIPDIELDRLAKLGFEWIWFLSVWQTGGEGERISRQSKSWRKEFLETLPDLREEDIAGSGFAIKRYVVSEQLGGDDALERLRKRLSERGLKLMLDFVPNHTGLDHDWIKDHIDFFISADESALEREPANYTSIKNNTGEMILAHGRDPFFSGWPDTLQLNYGNADLQEAMIGELKRIAGQCDGVRCDMAMLVLPDIFEGTWGIKCKPFWTDAIRRVREVNADFCFMAEVYWDLEWTMIGQGFDYAYDKRLYDRLKEANVNAAREHFSAGLDYQDKMARFLENHDEPRAAFDFPSGVHEAASVITFLSPGLRFFHQGQFEGRKKRISPHLVRAPEETVNNELAVFYEKLLAILRRPVFHNGSWQLIDCLPAWEGNWSNSNFISFFWQGSEGEKNVVAVNFSPFRSQCYVRLPDININRAALSFHDIMSGMTFERDVNTLNDNGLYLDEPAWKIYVFDVR